MVETIEEKRDQEIEVWRNFSELWSKIEQLQKDQTRMEMRIAFILLQKFNIDYYKEVYGEKKK